VTIRPDRRRRAGTLAGQVAPLIIAALGSGCATLPMPQKLPLADPKAHAEAVPGPISWRRSSPETEPTPVTRVEIVPSFGTFAPPEIPAHDRDSPSSHVAGAIAPSPAGLAAAPPSAQSSSALPSSLSIPGASGPPPGAVVPADPDSVATSPPPTVARTAPAEEAAPAPVADARLFPPPAEPPPRDPDVGAIRLDGDPVPVASDPPPAADSPMTLPDDLVLTPSPPAVDADEWSLDGEVLPSAPVVEDLVPAAAGDWGPPGAGAPVPALRPAVPTPVVPGPAPDVPPSMILPEDPAAVLPPPTDEVTPASHGQDPGDAPGTPPATPLPAQEGAAARRDCGSRGLCMPGRTPRDRVEAHAVLGRVFGNPLACLRRPDPGAPPNGNPEVNAALVAMRWPMTAAR
jgi:hypothetical protein